MGWDVIQSNNFTIKQEGDHVTLAGTGQGHGIGLCQAGAKAMALDGASFLQILSHYYPNTTVVSFAPNVAAARWSNQAAEQPRFYPGYQTRRGSSSLR